MNLLSIVLRSFSILAGAVVSCFGANPAQAGEYKLCNQTSYVLDAALAVQSGNATASQGWFRIYPGACETLMSRTNDGERYFIQTRTPSSYDASPQPSITSNMFCVGNDDFLIAGADECDVADGRLAPFTEVTADAHGDDGQTVLSGDTQFDGESARVAGLQRLLKLSGSNIAEVDGNLAGHTETALRQFHTDHPGLDDDPALFEALLLAALAGARTTGLTFCNDTEWTVFAAAGTTNAGKSRIAGWFELAPGRCDRIAREPLEGERLHTFAQAHDASGFPIIQDGKPLKWGGEAMFCTKPNRFEIEDHADCRGRGLESTGFTDEPIGDDPGRVIHFSTGE